jgi:hypothetical protein
MSKFDAWLERPYTEAAQEAADYEKFCEVNDLDPENEWTVFKFKAWQASWDTEEYPTLTEEGDE